MNSTVKKVVLIIALIAVIAVVGVVAYFASQGKHEQVTTNTIAQRTDDSGKAVETKTNTTNTTNTTSTSTINGKATLKGSDQVEVLELSDGIKYQIKDKEVEPEIVIKDKPLITAGGVVVGGTIIGGVKQGNTIVGAIVKGGVVSSGVTVNGETSGGTLIPTPSATVPITKPILQDPEYRDLRPETVPTPENPYTGPGIGQHVHEPSIPPGWSTDELTITHNMDEGSIKTNFGTAKIQGIDNLIDTPISVPRKEDHNW